MILNKIRSFYLKIDRSFNSLVEVKFRVLQVTTAAHKKQFKEIEWLS